MTLQVYNEKQTFNKFKINKFQNFAQNKVPEQAILKKMMDLRADKLNGRNSRLILVEMTLT